MKGQSQDRGLQRKLRSVALDGYDLVAEVVHLAAMNMYLHGIGETESPIHERDALARRPDKRWNVVLTNPPFGRMGAFSVIDIETGKVTKERESYERDDFIASTSNNQLPPRRPPRARGDRPLQALRLCRPRQTRSPQPRHLLAQEREPRG